jgi:purine nucleosidase
MPRLIIDTDTGIDDAVALLMAVAHPQTEIEAITTVMGNISLAQATHNAGVMLDIAHAPAIPIYRGCARPLMQHPPINAMDIHGSDGLGGASAPETQRQPQPEHAALAMVRLARENPGQLTLLTLGPLTNVALAIRLDAGFLANLERLVIMGGAVEAKGNTTPAAEFNFMADPEAAATVFLACRRTDFLPSVISWEVTLSHGLPMTIWRQLITGHTPSARFLQQITDFIDRQWPFNNVLWPDPLAAAVAMEPDIVLKQRPHSLVVEAGHNLARGQSIVDFRRGSEATPNAHVVRQVNLLRFQELLQTAAQL